MAFKDVGNPQPSQNDFAEGDGDRETAPTSVGEEVEPQAAALARRPVIGALIGLITAGITATLGAIIGRYSIAPAFAATKEGRWIDIGSLTDIAEGTTKKLIVVSQNVGWGRFNTQRLIWVVRRADKLMVFSAVCPHLGCTIQQTNSVFVCACHGSSWTGDGEKQAGPTPRNMDRLEYRIEQERVQVKYKRFRQGSTHQEALG